MLFIVTFQCHLYLNYCRYKDMADVANAAKGSGHYTPEDEIMIHKKAHAIINCYIDSSVPPRIQVTAAMMTFNNVRMYVTG